MVVVGGHSAAGRAGAADDEPVLIVGEILQRGLARKAGVAPVLAVGRVREVADFAARAAETAVEPLVGPAVAVKPLGDSSTFRQPARWGKEVGDRGAHKEMQ